MTTTKELSFVDKTNEGLAELMEEIEEQQKLDDPYDGEGYREPLSIETKKVVKILLSWGGPSDGFDLTFNDDQLESGIYWRADWGEYRETNLTDEEANTVFDFYMGGTL